MNQIIKIYNNLSNDELLILMNEIAECEITGSYPLNSNIRELCRNVSEITKLDVSSNLLMTQLNVLKEGAMRWRKFVLNDTIK